MINSNIYINSSAGAIMAMVELYNGSTLATTCTCSDFLSQFKLSRVGDESKFYGFGVCQRLDIELIDLNRVLDVKSGYIAKVAYIANGVTLYPYPNFYITEVNRDERGGSISVIAYDLINEASKHTIEEINLQSYTLTQLATACANALNLGFKTIGVNDAIFSLNYATGGNFEPTDTLRAVLDDIAEVTQTIYYIDNSGFLVFKRYSDTVATTITKDDYILLDTAENKRLGAICHATEAGESITASTAETGTTQYIRNNGLYELRTDVATLLDNAIALMGGFTLAQFTCGDWAGNILLEIGDKIGLETEDNKLLYSYLLNDVITYDGTIGQATEWNFTDNSTETASNPTTLGEALNKTFAKVDKVNKQIDLVASDVSSLNNSVSSLRITTNGVSTRVTKAENRLTTAEGDLANIEDDITALNTSVGEFTVTADEIKGSVTSVEKKLADDTGALNDEILTLKSDLSQTNRDLTLSITEIKENGVDKITTATGFTFNSEGLTIDKSGTPISTTINENGMIVRNEGNALLTANSTGVEATNLHANTYLIIGANSRFEDYNGTRTGCFWIGG